MTELEFAIIKTHPQVAFNILKPLQMPGQITQIIMQHHERMNGSGYPYGVRARISCWRPRSWGWRTWWRPCVPTGPIARPWGLNKALEEIANKRGILYDPEVVDNCLLLYQETPAALLGEVCHHRPQVRQNPWRLCPEDRQPGPENYRDKESRQSGPGGT